MKFFVINDFHYGDGETTMSLPRDYNQGPADECPRCGAAISMLKWLPPYRVTINLRGDEFGDLVFGTNGASFLVSELFADVWRHHGLKGLSGFHPVDVTRIRSRRKKRPEPPRYLLVEVGLGPARIDPQASGIVWVEPPTCAECLSAITARWQRAVFVEGTWEGEDIFEAVGFSGDFIVTERFKRMCEDFQIKNARFTPAENYAHDFYPGVTDFSDFK